MMVGVVAVVIAVGIAMGFAIGRLVGLGEGAWREAERGIEYESEDLEEGLDEYCDVISDHDGGMFPNHRERVHTRRDRIRDEAIDILTERHRRKLRRRRIRRYRWGWLNNLLGRLTFWARRRSRRRIYDGHVVEDDEAVVTVGDDPQTIEWRYYDERTQQWLGLSKPRKVG